MQSWVIMHRKTISLDRCKRRDVICSSFAMEALQDSAYCNLIAQRAVARAALHMGVEEMSQEALETLADVLLAYMSRIGKTLAVSVESSGRSSAHCNVLDCVHAIELNTEAVVQKVHSEDEQGERIQSSGRSDPAQALTWKGLAAFCFGPTWSQRPSERIRNGRDSGGAGGKVGPSSTGTHVSETGWNAPYPEELANFPIAPTKTANPHPLPDESVESLHNPARQQQARAHKEDLKTIPEKLLIASWGTIKPKTSSSEAATAGEKRKAPPEVEETQEEPPNKKHKSLDATATAAPSAQGQTGLPVYYPPFPLYLGKSKVIVDTEEDPKAVATEDTASSGKPFVQESMKVRSALVELGSDKKHWGSMESSLKVPVGRPEDSKGHIKPSIEPLGRASVAKVARILEGSMGMETG